MALTALIRGGKAPLAADKSSNGKAEVRLAVRWLRDAMLGAAELGNGKATHGEAGRSKGKACQSEAMA